MERREQDKEKKVDTIQFLSYVWSSAMQAFFIISSSFILYPAEKRGLKYMYDNFA